MTKHRHSIFFIYKQKYKTFHPLMHFLIFSNLKYSIKNIMNPINIILTTKITLFYKYLSLIVITR